MEDKERYELQGELKDAIASGEIENASPEKLQKWLISLFTGAIPNEMVRHNAIILGFTVNHIRTEQVIKKLEETIKKLNAANDKSQKTITYLTILATILAVVATAATVLQAAAMFIK